MDLTVSTLAFEAFLLVLARTAGFVAVAPLFSHQGVNARMRILIAMCLSICIYSSMNIVMPEYSTVIGYTFILIKELVVGLSLGFVASLVMSIIVFAGEFIDREIGFTMSSNFNASTGALITVTAELYDKLVYVIMLITNLHYFIITAIAQSFEAVPLGDVNIKMANLFTSAISFMGEYFSLGFRIAMPIFLSATILNIILGVLTKSSPQMNMFSVGLQLKVLCGLCVLVVAIMYIPNVTTYLMETMQSMLTSLLGGL